LFLLFLFLFLLDHVRWLNICNTFFLRIAFVHSQMLVKVIASGELFVAIWLVANIRFLKSMK
jgi:hypothetical protein